MKPLSHVAETMPRSGIREMMDLAGTLEGVIHLEVGEPSFNTPAHIIESALASARAGFTKYTPSSGLPSVRSAVAESVSAAWGQTVRPDEVMMTTGAVSALAMTVLAIAQEGDEVLLPDPGWPNYTSMVNISHAQPRLYALRPEDDYAPNPERLAALITPRTKALLINNPSNPTGAVFSAECVAALVQLAAEHDLYVIADEVYEHLVYDGRHTPAAVYDRERVITVSGCSKTYAMTGWRLGYLIAPPAFVSLLTKFQEPLVSCASAVSQCAAEAALKGPQDCVDEMREAYRRRRDLVCGELQPLGLLSSVPRGAFYVMVDLRRLGMTSRDLAFALLREERVATAPGATFGPTSEGMVRISLATDDQQLLEGCRRIGDFIARHSPSSKEA